MTTDAAPRGRGVGRLARQGSLSVAVGLIAGTLVALLLHRVLDGAVSEWAERDLARTLERLAPDAAASLGAEPEARALVERASRQLGVRLTLLAADGRVVADSDVEPTRLSSVENHAGRPEVVRARESGTGFDRRRSATVSEPFLYVARRIESAGAVTGYLRAAVAESELARHEAPSRRRLTALSVGAGLAVALLLVAVKRKHARELEFVGEAVARAAGGEPPGPVPQTTPETAEVLARLAELARLVREDRDRSERTGALLATVFDDLPVGLAVVDGSLGLVQVNPAFERALGLPAGSVRPGAHLVEAVRVADVLHAFERSLAGERVERQPVPFPRSGPPATLELTVFRLAGEPRSGVPAAVGVLREAPPLP